MRREHSRRELRGKLVAAGHEAEAVDRLLAQLEQERLLSDDRFAEAYIRYRSERGYGPMRIKAELRERGIDDSLGNEQLRAAEVDWFELAEHVRHKRFGSGSPRDFKERARQMRFLQYRGFTSEQIQAALDSDDWS